jgi:hypothetical protein
MIYQTNKLLSLNMQVLKETTSPTSVFGVSGDQLQISWEVKAKGTAGKCLASPTSCILYTEYITLQIRSYFVTRITVVPWLHGTTAVNSMVVHPRNLYIMQPNFK